MFKMSFTRILWVLEMGSYLVGIRTGNVYNEVPHCILGGNAYPSSLILVGLAGWLALPLFCMYILGRFLGSPD